MYNCACAYPIRLAVTRSCDTEANTMAKPSRGYTKGKSYHKSGRRNTVRNPGRRRYKPGPRPKATKITITNDRSRGTFTEEHTQNMTAVAAHWADTGEFPAEIETVYSPCICRWDRELAMIAFDGWKSLHYRLKQQQLEWGDRVGRSRSLRS